MSWSSGPHRMRQSMAHLALNLVALAIGLMLSGCTLTPLYAPSASGPLVAPQLASIGIEAANGRVEQEVRNQLFFAFTGGGPAAQARYLLRLTVSISENLVGVTRLRVSPSYSLDVAVSYDLSELSSNTILTRGVVHGVAAYDRSNQGFANARAKRDAEDRAAASAADEIRLRIAAALARGR